MIPRMIYGFAAVVLGLAAVACSGTRPAAPREEPLPVRIRTPARVRQAAQIAVSGSVEPQRTVDLAFSVAGRVARVLFDEGQEVGAGALVAEIDPADYQFGVEAAAAQTALARAAYEKALRGARAQELERARAAYVQREDEYQRLRQLFEKKSLAPADFKKIEAAYLAAKAQWEEAQEGARQEDRAAAKAAVEQAEAAERVARKKLADTRLVATAPGTVARRGVDPGEVAAAGFPVFTIVDLATAHVRVAVPESDIGLVRAGQPATVFIPALPGEQFTGRVDLVGAAADPASRAFSVKIAVPNPRRLLRAGMIAEARIQSDVEVDAITLPVDAVVRDPQGATLVFVYSPAQHRVYGRRVELGPVRGREVEIQAGLSADEPVVVAGQHQVREGMRVDAAEARP